MFTSFESVILNTREKLEQYFPPVLSTIILEYFNPVFGLATKHLHKPIDDRIKRIPPPDATWVRNEDKIAFYDSDGTPLGSVFINSGLYHIIITPVTLYVIALSFLMTDYWIVSSWTGDSKSICPIEPYGIWVSEGARFHPDNNSFAVFELGNYSSSTTNINHFFSAKTIDVAKYRNYYFALSAEDSRSLVTVYHYSGGSWQRTALYRFKGQSGGAPLSITANENGIILLTESQGRSYLELYSLNGLFLSQSDGPTSYNLGIRAIGNQLFVDGNQGCNIYQQI